MTEQLGDGRSRGVSARAALRVPPMNGWGFAAYVAMLCWYDAKDVRVRWTCCTFGLWLLFPMAAPGIPCRYSGNPPGSVVVPRDLTLRGAQVCHRPVRLF